MQRWWNSDVAVVMEKQGINRATKKKERKRIPMKTKQSERKKERGCKEKG